MIQDDNMDWIIVGIRLDKWILMWWAIFVLEMIDGFTEGGTR